MTRAQILRKKTGIILAIIGIVLSLLPAVRMADGTKLFIFQLIRNDIFFNNNMATEADYGIFLSGILLCVILIYGLLVHILNLFLWTKKTEKTYLGVMGFSWASFIGMIMSCTILSFLAYESVFAVFPYTIWQTLRIFVILFEAIMKLNGEEFFRVFFPEK